MAENEDKTQLPKRGAKEDERRISGKPAVSVFEPKPEHEDYRVDPRPGGGIEFVPKTQEFKEEWEDQKERTWGEFFSDVGEAGVEGVKDVYEWITLRPDHEAAVAASKKVQAQGWGSLTDDEKAEMYDAMKHYQHYIRPDVVAAGGVEAYKKKKAASYSIKKALKEAISERPLRETQEQTQYRKDWWEHMEEISQRADFDETGPVYGEEGRKARQLSQAGAAAAEMGLAPKEVMRGDEPSLEEKAKEMDKAEARRIAEKYKSSYTGYAGQAVEGGITPEEDQHLRNVHGDDVLPNQADWPESWQMMHPTPGIVPSEFAGSEGDSVDPKQLAHLKDVGWDLHKKYGWELNQENLDKLASYAAKAGKLMPKEYTTHWRRQEIKNAREELLALRQEEEKGYTDQTRARRAKLEARWKDFERLSLSEADYQAKLRSEAQVERINKALKDGGSDVKISVFGGMWGERGAKQILRLDKLQNDLYVHYRHELLKDRDGGEGLTPAQMSEIDKQAEKLAMKDLNLALNVGTGATWVHPDPEGKLKKTLSYYEDIPDWGKWSILPYAALSGRPSVSVTGQVAAPLFERHTSFDTWVGMMPTSWLAAGVNTHRQIAGELKANKVLFDSLGEEKEWASGGALEYGNVYASTVKTWLGYTENPEHTKLLIENLQEGKFLAQVGVALANDYGNAMDLTPGETQALGITMGALLFAPEFVPFLGAEPITLGLASAGKGLKWYKGAKNPTKTLAKKIDKLADRALKEGWGPHKINAEMEAIDPLAARWLRQSAQSETSLQHDVLKKMADKLRNARKNREKLASHLRESGLGYEMSPPILDGNRWRPGPALDAWAKNRTKELMKQNPGLSRSSARQAVIGEIEAGRKAASEVVETQTKVGDVYRLDPEQAAALPLREGEEPVSGFAYFVREDGGWRRFEDVTVDSSGKVMLVGSRSDKLYRNEVLIGGLREVGEEGRLVADTSRIADDATREAAIELELQIARDEMWVAQAKHDAALESLRGLKEGKAKALTEFLEMEMDLRVLKDADKALDKKIKTLNEKHGGAFEEAIILQGKISTANRAVRNAEENFNELREVLRKYREWAKSGSPHKPGVLPKYRGKPITKDEAKKRINAAKKVLEKEIESAKKVVGEWKLHQQKVTGPAAEEMAKLQREKFKSLNRISVARQKIISHPAMAVLSKDEALRMFKNDDKGIAALRKRLNSLERDAKQTKNSLNKAEKTYRETIKRHNRDPESLTAAVQKDVALRVKISNDEIMGNSMIRVYHETAKRLKEGLEAWKTIPKESDRFVDILHGATLSKNMSDEGGRTIDPKKFIEDIRTQWGDEAVDEILKPYLNAEGKVIGTMGGEVGDVLKKINDAYMKMGDNPLDLSAIEVLAAHELPDALRKAMIISHKHGEGMGLVKAFEMARLDPDLRPENWAAWFRSYVSRFKQTFSPIESELGQITTDMGDVLKAAHHMQDALSEELLYIGKMVDKKTRGQKPWQRAEAMAEEIFRYFDTTNPIDMRGGVSRMNLGRLSLYTEGRHQILTDARGLPSAPGQGIRYDYIESVKEFENLYPKYKNKRGKEATKAFEEFLTNKHGPGWKVDRIEGSPLSALSRMYVPGAKPASSGQKIWLYATAHKHLKDSKTFEEFSEKMFKSTKRHYTKKAMESQRSRGLAMGALAIGHGAVRYRSNRFMEKAMGGFVSPKEAQDVVNYLGNNAHLIESGDQYKVLENLNKIGQPMTKHVIRPASSPKTAVYETLVGVGQDLNGRHYIQSRVLADKINTLMPSVTKELTENFSRAKTPQELFAANRDFNWARWWKTSVVTGTINPRPQYLINNWGGDWAQMSMELGMFTGSKVSYQLLTGLPFYNKYMYRVQKHMWDKYGGYDKALGSVWNAVFNPHANRVWNGEQGMFRTKYGQEVPYRELTRWMQEDGILDTYVHEELLQQFTRLSPKWYEDALAPFPAGKHLGRAVRGVHEGLGSWRDTITWVASYIQQRQRGNLYMELIKQGYTRKAAKSKVMDALYDWKYGPTEWETRTILKWIPYHRFWRLAQKQTFNAVADPFVRPDGEFLRALGLGETFHSGMAGSNVSKLKRIHQIKTFQETWPYIMDPELADDANRNSEDFAWLAKHLRPEWMSHRGIFDQFDTPERLKDHIWQTKRKSVDHNLMMMPPFTPLDSMELWSSWITGMTAFAFSAAGKDSVWGHHLSEDAATNFFRPSLDLMFPHSKIGAEAVLGYFGVNTNASKYQSDPHRFSPKINMKQKGLMDSSLWPGQTWFENGAWRGDANVINTMNFLPVIGTELPRIIGPAWSENPWMQDFWLKSRDANDLKQAIRYGFMQWAWPSYSVTSDPGMGLERPLSQTINWRQTRVGTALQQKEKIFNVGAETHLAPTETKTLEEIEQEVEDNWQKMKLRRQRALEELEEDE
tara:strand:+ start:16923 stop:24167 length:7245 start_codon:yes stop_codon:yes gene_type:complete